MPIKKKGIFKAVGKVVKGVAGITPVGRAVTTGLGIAGKIVGGLRGVGKGRAPLKRRRPKGISMKFIRNFRLKLIRAKFRNRLMREELKGFKGL